MTEKEWEQFATKLERLFPNARYTRDQIDCFRAALLRRPFDVACKGLEAVYKKSQYASPLLGHILSEVDSRSSPSQYRASQRGAYETIRHQLAKDNPEQAGDILAMGDGDLEIFLGRERYERSRLEYGSAHAITKRFWVMWQIKLYFSGRREIDGKPYQPDPDKSRTLCGYAMLARDARRNLEREYDGMAWDG